MKSAFLIGCLLAGTAALAQREVDVTNGEGGIGVNSMFTVHGTPFLNEKYVRVVSGSPYFRDDYMNAILVSDKGQEHKGIQVRLNLHGGEVVYKMKGNAAEMTATTTIKEVILIDLDSTNYRFVHSNYLPSTKANPLDVGWYLWLGSGTASLYKHFKKDLRETTPYGQATTERSITTKESYIIQYNNTYFEVKKIKDVPGILANKRKELEDYLQNQDDRSLNIDDRFAKLISYYNSLFAKS